MDLDRRHRRSRALTRLAATGVALVSVLALQSSASANLEDTLAQDTRLPGQGLPGYAQNPGTGGTWLNPQAASLNYATAAKQWIKPPVFQAVAKNLQTQQFNDPRCSGALGEGIQSRREYRAPVVFVNTDLGADSAGRFGRTQEFTVRTVAFGSVPVEVDIALEQSRNDQGAAIAAMLSQTSSSFCPGEGPFPVRRPGAGSTSQAQTDISLVGSIAVRITGLRLDGVNVGPLETCTAPDAQLSLTAQDYFSWDPEPTDEERPPVDGADVDNRLSTKYFSLSGGGLLTGTLDVPDFSGCRTPGGDDLSPLLTAAVSSDGNPVTIRSEGLPAEQGLDDGTALDDPRIPACPWRSNVCTPRLPQLDIPEGTPSG